MNRSLLSMGLLSLLLSACSSLLPPQTQESEVPIWEAINQLKLDQQHFASKESVNTLNDKIAQLNAENQILNQQLDELKKLLTKPKVAASSSPRPAPAATTETITPSDYQNALTLYQKRQFNQTIITLKPYAFGADHSKEAQDAMYLLSLSHLKLRHCEATIDISRRFAQLFPQHKNASEALYNVIACQVSLQQKDIARETLRLLANDYPNSSALARAKAKLK